MKHPLITSDVLYYKIRNHMIVDLYKNIHFISKC